MAIASIEVFSRYHVTSSDRRARLQNEVSTTLEHMSKQLLGAIGNTGNWAVKVNNNCIRVRLDSNHNGFVDDNDTWIAYCLAGISTPDPVINFYPNAGTDVNPGGTIETLAHKITVLQFSPGSPDGSLDATDGSLHDSVLKVEITARWLPDPAHPASQDNPEVTMNNKISMPSVSTR